MITLEKAGELAEDEIHKIEHDDILIIEHVAEFDQGWLFYFNSKKYLDTRNILYRPLGLGSVIVGKENDVVFPTGSGRDEEYWMEEFKKYIQSRK